MKTYNIIAKHPNNDTRNILYNIACGVQVPAPALCGTAWSDCVVTLAGRSSAVRLDPCARRLRIPFACRGIYKITVGKKFRLGGPQAVGILFTSYLIHPTPGWRDIDARRNFRVPVSRGCLQSKFRIHRMSEKFKRAFVEPDQMWGCAMDLWSIRWFR